MPYEPTSSKHPFDTVQDKYAINNTSLILASGSPRRQYFLRALGLPFRVITPDMDESPLADELPVDLAHRLAQEKARTVAARVSQCTEADDWSKRTLVIAADTVVGLGNRQLGKPADEDDVRSMLRELRGRVHQVHTAVSVLEMATGKQQTRLHSTNVLMRDYSDAEIDGYIATGDPMDKAGAYAIQHPLFQPAVQIEDELGGCFASVVGLPLVELLSMLGDFGVAVKASLPPVCEALGQFRCCRRRG